MCLKLLYGEGALPHHSFSSRTSFWNHHLIIPQFLLGQVLTAISLTSLTSLSTTACSKFTAPRRDRLSGSRNTRIRVMRLASLDDLLTLPFWEQDATTTSRLLDYHDVTQNLTFTLHLYTSTYNYIVTNRILCKGVILLDSTDRVCGQLLTTALTV